jgi:hypothetical protein
MVGQMSAQLAVLMREKADLKVEVSQLRRAAEALQERVDMLENQAPDQGKLCKFEPTKI